jgi:two-component system chemotaxis response regulator CheB
MRIIRGDAGKDLSVSRMNLRVLIADDSGLYRQMLMNVLRKIPQVEVVGLAVDGLDTIEKLVALRPDVVTLDVQMPKLDGLGVLREMNQRGIATRAIMVSSLTTEGAPATIEALMEGAFDFVAKPIDLEPHLARASLQESLLEKLSLVGAVLARGQAEVAKPVVPVRPPPILERRNSCFDAIAIGTSTGGPEALRRLLPGLPADLPVPVLIVQHMPAGFTASLAQRLDAISPLTVFEASDAAGILPGQAALAPGGMHLRVVRRAGAVMCGLDAGPARLGCRPSFDVLLESLVQVYGGRLLVAVLTGMGQDGLAGCAAVKAAGGTVLAQDAESCVVYGMPKAVIDKGLADEVVPISGMTAAILRWLPRSAT